MAQHFLLTEKARDLSLMQLFNMNEDEAFEYFKVIRWSNTNGVSRCPSCETCHEPYFISTGKQFRCKHCEYTFSTIFANHKKLLKIYLIIIALFTNAVKSTLALQLSRD